jgi:hypothetical protein
LVTAKLPGLCTLINFNIDSNSIPDAKWKCLKVTFLFTVEIIAVAVAVAVAESRKQKEERRKQKAESSTSGTNALTLPMHLAHFHCTMKAAAVCFSRWLFVVVAGRVLL